MLCTPVADLSGVIALTVLSVQTASRCQLVSITEQVSRAVEQSGIKQGICVVYVPHTTAGVMINENADPEVRHDILSHLERMVPFECSFRHVEGNSAAHIKSVLVGHSVTLIVEKGALVLGRWQDVYFAEFDGPRRRLVYVRVVGSPG